MQTPRRTGILAEAHHIHHGAGIMLSNEFPVNYFSVSEVEQEFPEFQVRKNQGFGQKGFREGVLTRFVGLQCHQTTGFAPRQWHWRWGGVVCAASLLALCRTQAVPHAHWVF